MKQFILNMLKVGDYIVICIALLLSLFFIFCVRGAQGNAKRLILFHGENRTPLSWQDRTISLFDITNKQMFVQIQGGQARVISSSCPDKVCVLTGWVSKCGEMAACLPNGVALFVDCQGNDLNVTESK